MTIYSSSARTLACTVAAATCLVGLGASSAVVAPAAVASESGPFASVRGQTITVVMEGGSTSTPDIQKLLPQFERATGIHVNYDVIPYDSLTSRVLLDFSSQQSSPDVVFDDWAYGRQFATDHYIVPLNSFDLELVGAHVVVPGPALDQGQSGVSLAGRPEASKPVSCREGLRRWLRGT